MKRDRIIAAIDVGTSKVSVVVADLSEMNEARVLGYGITPSQGVSRGVIDNLQSARDAIAAAVERAEQSSGMRILSAVASISGTHIGSQNNRGIIAVPDRTHPIRPDDRDRVLDIAGQISIPTNRTILHTIPRGYWIDGTEPVTDPVDMYGARLDAEAHIVTAATSAVQNHTKCVESAGVQVDDLVFTGLASATSVLAESERRQGVAVVDIGAGTTSLAVFDDGAIAHTAVFPIAGYHVTQDLAGVLRCPFDNAERLKIEVANIRLEPGETNRMVEVETFGTKKAKEIPLGHIAEIAQARCDEILEMVTIELKKSGYATRIAAGLVLTGGTSQLPGLAARAEDQLGIPVRVGTPREFSGLSEMVASPAYSAVIGLAQHALSGTEPTIEPSFTPGHHGSTSSGESLMSRLRTAMRTLMP